ncbi:MAG: hypothetical protein PVJ02_04395 [Gemmatimonadota bacterium]|jgi:hypothetical protein
MRPVRSSFASLGAALLLVFTAFSYPLTAQTLPEVTATPDQAATLFLRSIRSIRWSAAAQFMAPATLERFHDVVTMITETDTTGQIRRDLLDADARGYAALTPAEVFDRAVGTMIDGMPGLMHAFYDHDDEVIGHVAKGADTAFVVYRTVERLSGAVPQVKVMEMGRTPRGWRVVWSDELEVLEAALRGIPRTRRPPAPLTRLEAPAEPPATSPLRSPEAPPP